MWGLLFFLVTLLRFSQCALVLETIAHLFRPYNTCELPQSFVSGHYTPLQRPSVRLVKRLPILYYSPFGEEERFPVLA